MFRARFKRYWCDSAYDYKEITANSINEILEFAYKIHKNAPHPKQSRFYCRGICSLYKCGILEVDNSLPKKCGYFGSLWLEKILYNGPNGEVIVFSKHDEYASPKTSAAFDAFAEEVKKREENKNFGEYDD